MPRLAEKLLVMPAAAGGHCCASPSVPEPARSSAASTLSSPSPRACDGTDVELAGKTSMAPEGNLQPKREVTAIAAQHRMLSLQGSMHQRCNYPVSS